MIGADMVGRIIETLDDVAEGAAHLAAVPPAAQADSNGCGAPVNTAARAPTVVGSPVVR